MRPLIPCFAFLGLPLAAQAPASQDAFFGLDKLWDVRIEIDADAWMTLFPKTRPAPPERVDYTYAKARVRLAGHAPMTVGLRFKGNSTFWMTVGMLKRSFKIDFDRYTAGQTFLGLKKLNLNNNALDSTQIRESVSYAAYRAAGVPASRTAFARVYLTIRGEDEVQGVYLGLYTLIEQVDRGLLKRQLGQKGELVKPTWQVLRYYGDKWSARYARAYGPKTEAAPAAMQPIVDLAKLNDEFAKGWSDAPTLTDAEERRIQDGFAARLTKVMDVDAFLHYTAVTTLIGNQDSPFVFPHNYYLVVPDDSKRVLWIPWDLNNTMGGLGVFGGSQLHRQSIMVPTKRAIFARVLEVPQFGKRYRAIVKRLIEGPISAKEMVRRIELADRTTRAAKVAEKKRPKIVRRAGRLGGRSRGRSVSGFGGSSRISKLVRFVQARETSVLDQLAGRSEGIPARRSALDAMTGRRRR